MSKQNTTDLYGALLGLRAKESNRLGVMPYIVLSDSCIRDILKLRPSNLDTLKSISNLSMETQKSIGEEILLLVQKSSLAASVPPSDLPKDVEPTPKNRLPIVRGRNKPMGGQLAMEEDDIRILPLPVIASPSPTHSLYQRYQSEMKPILSLCQNAEELEKAQNKLLDYFCSGSPLQLSRLGIPPAKEVSTALPTLLSLRNSASDATLRLETQDLNIDSHLALSLHTIFPSITTTQIRLSLCEWYHDLHPELQLNSAKFKLPPITIISSYTATSSSETPLVNIKKRKSPTDITSIEKPQNIATSISNPPLAPSEASHRPTAHLTTVQTLSNSSEPKERQNPENPSSAASTHGFPMTPHSQHSNKHIGNGSLSKGSDSRRRGAEIVASRSSHLDEGILDDDTVEGYLEGDANVLDDDVERDPTYEDGKPIKSLFSPSSRSIRWSASKSAANKSGSGSNLQSEAWRHEGTRPKKQAKRSSIDAIGFIPFASNTVKERTTLTDDDFAGTEAAYFADVYAPQPISFISPLPPSQSPLISSLPAPASLEHPEKRVLEQEVIIDAGNGAMGDSNGNPSVAIQPALISASQNGIESNQLGSSSGQGKSKLEAIEAMVLMNLFSRIRRTANGVEC